MPILSSHEKHAPQTLTRKGSLFPPPVIARRYSRRHRIHPLTLHKMTAHNAFRIWFNDFLSVDCFARHHGLTREKARELIREGREIEEQIEKLKQEHNAKQK
jgi:hypothetical protein